MKFCPMCGKAVAAGDRFCAACGALLDRSARQASQGEARMTGTGPTISRSDESSVPQRLGRTVARHRGASLAAAVIAGIVVTALVAVLLTRDSQPDCYATAIKYGDLARRVDYGQIEEIRGQMNIEVEDDAHRRAAQLTINFVSSSKILGGETYPSRSELEAFVRSSAC